MLKILIVVLLVYGIECAEQGTNSTNNSSSSTDSYVDDIKNVTHYVQLYNTVKKGVFCGGAIIDAKWIVTSALCVTDESNEPLKNNVLLVITGSGNRYNGNTQDQPSETHKIKQLLPHPDFDDYELKNDLALIELEDSLKWNDRQKPIKIRSSPLGEAGSVKLSGLGVINDDKQKQQDSSTTRIKSAVLPVISVSQCQEMFYNELHRDKTVYKDLVFCSKAVHGEACRVESGSPVRDSEGDLAGVVSWKPVACDGSIPNVYTNLVHYRDWIRNKTNIKLA